MGIYQPIQPCLAEQSFFKQPGSQGQYPFLSFLSLWTLQVLFLVAHLTSGLYTPVDIGIQNHVSTTGILKLWEWVKKKDVGWNSFFSKKKKKLFQEKENKKKIF